MSYRVLIIGSAEQSGGGVSAVIKLYKRMPVWNEFHCRWLGTQIQSSKTKKLWTALKAYFTAFFIIWDYDIVHFHTVPDISMKVQLPIFILAKLWRKKTIVHLHVGNQLAMNRFTDFKLAHYCMKEADRLVLLSPLFLKHLNEYWIDVNTQRTIIANPCEEVFSLPYQQHTNTILFVGRFTDNKRADTLIQAFGLIHQKHPTWKLQLLAQGPEEKRCRQMIKDLGIAEKVEIPGFVYHEKKASYFRQAGILCLCSQYEGLPMVALEAWSYGVPVVSTPAGAMPGLIKEKYNGFLYDFGDFEALADILDILMSDQALRAKMSAYSKEFVNKKFSSTIINAQLNNLYQDLLNN